MSVVVIEQGQGHAMIWGRILEYSLIDVSELLEMGYTHISVSA